MLIMCLCPVTSVCYVAIYFFQPNNEPAPPYSPPRYEDMAGSVPTAPDAVPSHPAAVTPPMAGYAPHAAALQAPGIGGLLALWAHVL